MSTLKVKGISAPTGYKLAMPAGHILQTVYVNVNNNTTTNSTSFVNMHSETLAITPSSTSSKILVGINAGGMFYSSGGSARCALGLKRDSTEIMHHERYGYKNVDNWFPMTWSMTWIDSPSTTSQISYKWMFSCNDNNAEVRVGDYQTNNNNRNWHIYAMEVAG